MDLEYLINNNVSYELRDIIRKYFDNDEEFFFEHLIDENLIPENSVSDGLFYLFPNEYINYLIDNGKGDIVKEFFSQEVSDIVKKGDKYYLEVPHLSDLHKLFPTEVQDFVENILGDDFYGAYESYHNYRTSELIDDLTKENFERLIEHIKEKFLNKTIHYDGDNETILSFIESDGSEDYFVLSANRLSQIIEQSNFIGLEELIDNSEDLSDLKSDMNSWYNWAYENAMNDEYYNTVIDAIKSVFNIPRNQNIGEYEQVNTYNRDGKLIKKDYLFIDITEELLGYIKESIQPEIGYWGETEEITGNYGSLLSYLNDYYRAGRVNFDYISPSWMDVLKNYNSNFLDNI